MENMIGKTIGGCEIESIIGQGGMGTVYMALHTTLCIQVAVKILHSLADVPGSEERFLREAKITARVRHSNIVYIMNAGIENGIYFIVMEYVDGCNLQKVIDKEGKLSVEKALKITKDILLALETAYEEGVVHRDIKPENILVDNFGAAKLADLGLARVISGNENLTQSNTMLGSPHYIAPEQADNPSSVDCRTDIYSLGCTMYHMFTGVAPFPGKSIIEIVMNHVKCPVPKIKDKIKDFPEYISDIVFTMMQKDPAKRFSNPSEVIRSFDLRKSTITTLESVNSNSVNRSSVASGKKNTIIITVLALVLLILFGITIYIQQKDRVISIKLSDAVDTLSQQEDSTLAKNDTVTSVKKKTTKNKISQKVKNEITEQIEALKPDTKENPLIAAVKIGDTEGLKTLLGKGVSPKCDQSSPTTPLHEAVRRGLTVETQMLLKSGAEANARDKSGNTALHYAIKENASLMVKLLLENGASPNIKDSRGKSPLQMAESIDSELEKLLESYGAK